MWTFLWECKSLIRARDVDRSNLAAKSDLASLKAQVHKMDLNKLKRVPTDLIKLSDIDGNDVVKKNCLWSISHESKYYCFLDIK